MFWHGGVGLSPTLLVSLVAQCAVQRFQQLRGLPVLRYQRYGAWAPQRLVPSYGGRRGSREKYLGAMPPINRGAEWSRVWGMSPQLTMESGGAHKHILAYSEGHRTLLLHIYADVLSSQNNVARHISGARPRFGETAPCPK